MSKSNKQFSNIKLNPLSDGLIYIEQNGSLEPLIKKTNDKYLLNTEIFTSSGIISGPSAEIKTFVLDDDSIYQLISDNLIVNNQDSIKIQVEFTGDNVISNVVLNIGTSVVNETMSEISVGSKIFEVILNGLSGDHENEIINISFDSDGNTLSKNGPYITIDNTAPILRLNGSDTIEIDVLTGTYTELGAFVLNESDLNQFIVSTGLVDTSTVGNYTITYSLSQTDAAGNAATYITRSVSVVDNVPPVLQLNTPSVMYLVNNTTYDEEVTATDTYDDVKSLPLTIETIVNGSSSAQVDTSSSPNEYNILYDVQDSSGNQAVQKQRTVYVYNKDAPSGLALSNQTSNAIELSWSLVDTLGIHNIVLNKYEIFRKESTEADYISVASVNENTYTMSLSGLEQGKKYDILVRAVYNVYDYSTDLNGVVSTDPSGDSNVVQLTISDTVPPVITVVGEDPVFLMQNGTITTYNDAEATATDKVDGDISNNIVVSGDIPDVTTEEKSVITYNVSDAEGNNAVEETRTVYVFGVKEPNAPTLNLGSIEYGEILNINWDTVWGTPFITSDSETIRNTVIENYILTFTPQNGNGTVKTKNVTSISDSFDSNLLDNVNEVYNISVTANYKNGVYGLSGQTEVSNVTQLTVTEVQVARIEITTEFYNPTTNGPKSNNDTNTLFPNGWTLVSIKNEADIIGATTWSVSGYDHTYTYDMNLLTRDWTTSFNNYSDSGISFTRPGNGQTSLPMTVSSGIQESPLLRLIYALPGNVTLDITTISDIGQANIDKTKISVNGVFLN